MALKPSSSSSSRSSKNEFYDSEGEEEDNDDDDLRSQNKAAAIIAAATTHDLTRLSIALHDGERNSRSPNKNSPQQQHRHFSRPHRNASSVSSPNFGLTSPSFGFGLAADQALRHERQRTISPTPSSRSLSSSLNGSTQNHFIRRKQKEDDNNDYHYINSTEKYEKSF